MSRITPLVILVAFFSIPFKSQAQRGGVTGRITFLDSLPIELVSVSLVELNKQTLTNSDGVYLIEGVPPGRHTLRIQMFDTKQIDLPVEVTAGQNSDQDYRLTKENISALQEGQEHKQVLQERKYLYRPPSFEEHGEPPGL